MNTMSEDDSSTSPPERRSWLDRISSMLSGEPSTREDLVELLRDAQADGLIAADTLRMMEGAIAVSDLTVGDVMIPRAQMVALSADASLPGTDEAGGRIRAFALPGARRGQRRDPRHPAGQGPAARRVAERRRAATVHELLRPAVLIPESKKLNVLLREFRQSRNHMAIVIDEYGGVAGLVTIEDVLEQIVGEIDDEHDEAEDPKALIAAQADGHFAVDALTPIADFNERFGADFDDDEYDTIGGLVTAAIGHLPEAGEELTLGRFSFRIARADARRLHALHVSVHADT